MLGFTIKPAGLAEHHPAVMVTDFDFADGICLITEEIDQAQELLTRVEEECARVGLTLNAKKTEVMIYNTARHPPLRTKDGSTLKVKEDFNTWAHGSTHRKRT